MDKRTTGWTAGIGLTVFAGMAAAEVPQVATDIPPVMGWWRR